MAIKIVYGKYKIHAGNYDWGCGIDKAIITLQEEISSISAQKIKVIEHKMVSDESTTNMDLHTERLPRKITNAYLCDIYGNRIEGPSAHFAIELYVSPTEGSPFANTTKAGIFHWSTPYELNISYDGDMILAIHPSYTQMTTAADMFAKNTYTTSDGTVYDYASYSPENDSKTLFVWLHGLGEGHHKNSDVYLPLLGHKGTCLASDKFQNMIGGAHILVPQCQTYWMDGDGQQSNFVNRLIEADTHSYYTESLYEFIMYYAKKIGAEKIAIGGCSNGGYMSVLLAMNYPDKFCAAIPICEAVPDASISDEQIKQLAKVPLYFIYSADDPVVIPEVHEIPTIRRLQAAECKDLHVFEAKEVIDTSGLYKDALGNPHKYNGHLSWIYFDNNETDDGTGLSAWEWLGQILTK